jgi:tetratricopeptide (TPR) repeat protein
MASMPSASLDCAVLRHQSVVSSRCASEGRCGGTAARHHTDAERAVQLDPQNYLIRINLALFLHAARRFDEAIAAAQDAKALKPEGTQIANVIFSSRLALGQTEVAKQMCESPATPIDESDRHRCLALAYHALGRQKDAEGEMMKLQALDGDSGAYEYAEVYAQWGNATAALDWLTTAERLYDMNLQGLKNSWKLDPIRGDPRFKANEKRMNYPP